MSSSTINLRDGEQTYEFIIEHRDWSLLLGPGFREGLAFSNAFGVYENFTVARGVPSGSTTVRRGKVLYDAAFALSNGIKRDADLLAYDYSYTIGDDPAKHTGGQSVQLRGRHGIISTRPKGYCSIELFDKGPEGSPPRVAEFLDLRILTALETDRSRTIKVFRRKAAMEWPRILPPLLEFLERRREKMLEIEHVERKN